MESKKDRLIALTGNLLCNEFFSDEWDRAILGFAVRGGNGKLVLPVYSYQVMKAILKENFLTPRETYAMLQKTLSNTEAGHRPLLLTKYSTKALWNMITSYNLPRWDYLNKAILGIGTARDGMHAICYNKADCINILASIDSKLLETDTEDDMLIRAETKLNNEICSVSLGNNTPWFITFVK